MISTSVKYRALSTHETIILTTDEPSVNPGICLAYGRKACEILFFQYQPMYLDAEFDGKSDSDIKCGMNLRFD